MDFITDLLLTKTGHDSILVLVDSLSKMAHFIPAKKTFTTADTVDVLADRLIRYRGLPEAPFRTVIHVSNQIYGSSCVRVLTSNALYLPPTTPRATAKLNE